MMNYLVSIIIPTYNRANYLDLAIKSVLGQTYENIEIIVIDDGSTDNTKKIIDNFKDSRIKYFWQSNKGLPAIARNVGLQKSSGEYIAFLDDDDLWCPDKLEIQMKYLESHTEVDVVYSNAFIIDEYENRKGLFMDHLHPKNGKIFPDLLGGNFIPILTVLMRRRVVDINGLLNEENSIKSIEDYEYMLRAALKFDIGYIDKPLAMYRIHSTGISRANSVAILRQKVLQKLLNNGEVAEKYQDAILRNIERLDFSASVYHWSVSDKKNARNNAKCYIFSSLKNIKLINFIMGILLYIIINLNYKCFINIISNYESKIARII